MTATQIVAELRKLSDKAAMDEARAVEAVDYPLAYWHQAKGAAYEDAANLVDAHLVPAA